MTNDDPIIAEVRAARAKLMRECNNDVNKLFERLKEMEREHPERIVTKADLDSRRQPEKSKSA